MTRIGSRDEEHEEMIDVKLRSLARDVASCALVNAGMFRAHIPGDRKNPQFNQLGEFIIDLFEGPQMVAQVTVRDARMVPSLNSHRVSQVLVKDTNTSVDDAHVGSRQK